MGFVAGNKLGARGAAVRSSRCKKMVLVEKFRFPCTPGFLGSLAGREAKHPFAYGMGSNCLRCFGWIDDWRHM